MNSPTRSPGERARRVVENDEFAAFTRRVLKAYARRVAAGDVEALNGLRQLSSDVDSATAVAVEGLRAFGYSWSEIAQRLGVTRQAAQMRWGTRTERRRVDERLLVGGLRLTVAELVVVYVDHFRADGLVGACPGCGYLYVGFDAECPSFALAASLLYRRRQEDPKALRLLTPAQFSYLHDRRGSSEPARSVNQTTNGGSSLFHTTVGGR